MKLLMSCELIALVFATTLVLVTHTHGTWIDFSQSLLLWWIVAVLGLAWRYAAKERRIE